MAVKLIHKTLRMYLIISISVFIISIPVFYVIVQKLWMKDIDESLVYQKEQLIQGIDKHNITSEDILNFVKFSSKIDNGIVIHKLTQAVYKKDSIYNHSFYDSIRKHVEPFRELTAYATINKQPYQIIIRRDLVESEDLLAGIVVAQFSIFILLLALIHLISIGYSRRIWNPFFTLTRKLQEIHLDKASRIEVNCRNIYEFEDLKTSVNALIAHNHQLFLAQKEFTENAAHEIQTPLAVIKSQLNLLSNEASLTSSQMEHISHIDYQIRYIASLNRNLLLLTKIDNRQFALDETVDLTALVSGHCEYIREEVHLANKEIVFQEKPVTLTGSNTILLISLCNNLINNAVKYSSPHSTIYILLNETQLEVLNAGRNEPLPAESIFHRFYKTDASTSGSGLGLSIVTQICKTLNFKIEYRFRNPDQHLFTVFFNQ